MIKIKVNRDDNINSIIINGHANYASYGKDIVCAAVSATVLTTVNGIIAIDEAILKITNQKDKFIIEVLKNDNISQTLLNNMLSCLSSLCIEYPKNIKIEN